jgi:ABC-type multidrug transport system ATPase subunit
MNKILIKCSNISYQKNGVNILNNIDLDIFSNQITAIIGPNGSGKTSLLKILFGLLKSSSGTIQRNYNLFDSSFIFQQHVFLNMTVSEILNHALFCKNISRSIRKEIVIDTIKKYNLSKLKDKNIRLLSGGEQQIIALIRSIILSPKLLYYDEPLNNLDKYSCDYIIDILQELHESDVQLLVVTHDMTLVDKLNCKTINISKGRIITHA